MRIRVTTVKTYEVAEFIEEAVREALRTHNFAQIDEFLCDHGVTLIAQQTESVKEEEFGWQV